MHCTQVLIGTGLYIVNDRHMFHICLKKWLFVSYCCPFLSPLLLAKLYIPTPRHTSQVCLFASFQHGHLAPCSRSVAAAVCLILFLPDGLHVPIILLPVSHAPCLCLVFQSHLDSLPLKEHCPHLQQR